jgi:hypothetical protein
MHIDLSQERAAFIVKVEHAFMEILLIDFDGFGNNLSRTVGVGYAYGHD